MLQYSSIVPNIQFDSVLIEKSSVDDKINITFSLYWEDEQKPTWTNNLDYLNYHNSFFKVFVGANSESHLEFKSSLMSNDTTILSSSFNNLVDNNDVYSRIINFKDFYNIEELNENISSGKVLEKTVGNLKKYVFPIQIIIDNISALSNISIYSLSTINLKQYLVDKEIPENIAEITTTEFVNSFVLDSNVINYANLIIDNTVQQSNFIINDFRIQDDIYKLIQESAILDSGSYLPINIEQDVIKKTINKKNPIVFSDLLIDLKEDNNIDVSFLFDKPALYKDNSFFSSSNINEDFEVVSFNVYRHLLDENNFIIQNLQKQKLDTVIEEFVELNEVTAYYFSDSYSKQFPNQKFAYELEVSCLDKKLKKYYDVSNGEKKGIYFDLLNLLNSVSFGEDQKNTSLYSYYYEASQPRTTIKNITYDNNPHIIDDKVLTYPSESVGYYNASINRLDSSFVEYARNQYSIYLLIEELQKTIGFIMRDIYFVDSEIADSFVRQSLDPTTATPNTILNFIKFVEVILFRLETIFRNVKSNTFTYNKIFVNNFYEINNLQDNHFVYNNNLTLNKDSILEYFKTAPSTFTPERPFFAPIKGKLFGTTYTNFVNIPNNSNAFKDDTLTQKLLNYYRILDLNKNFYDSYDNLGSVKDVAFINNCVSNSNKLVIETELNNETSINLNVQDQFTVNRFQAGISSVPDDTLSTLPNKFNPKQNFGNLFGNQENSRITVTPLTFVENPNAIKAENELLFYLFIFNTTETEFDSLTYVPIAKIQYLDYNSTVSNLAWQYLDLNKLNNLNNDKYLCKFELIDVVQNVESTSRGGLGSQRGQQGPQIVGEPLFKSIPLLASNINKILLKNKFFTFINKTTSFTPTFSPQNNPAEQLLSTNVQLGQVEVRQQVVNASVQSARQFLEIATRNFRRR